MRNESAGEGRSSSGERRLAECKRVLYNCAENGVNFTLSAAERPSQVRLTYECNQVVNRINAS